LNVIKIVSENISCLRDVISRNYFFRFDIFSNIHIDILQLILYLKLKLNTYFVFKVYFKK